MDISSISTGILKQNRTTASRRLPDAHAQASIDAINAELARRAERKSHKGGTEGYVLTATGQFEHKAGEREGHTKCGAEIDATRQYGTREWWHCLSCGE